MINFTQQPQQYTPAYNNQYFVFSGNNTTQSQHQFLVTLVNGTDNSIISKHRVNSKAGTSFGIFDPQYIISNKVSHDFKANEIDFQPNTNSYYKYKIMIGETYLSGNTIVINENLITGNTITVYNSSLDEISFINYDYNNYVVNTGTTITGGILSNRPSTLEYTIKGNQNQYLYFLDTDKQVYKALITKYDVYKNNIGSEYIYNNYSADTFTRLGVGTKNLRDSLIPSFFNDAISYDVKLYNINNHAVSNTYKFNICNSIIKPKYEIIRMHFLNKLGGFDTFNFNKLSTKSTKIDSSEYLKNRYQLYNDGTYTTSLSNAGSLVNNTNYADSYTVNSDWLKENEYNWLFELVSSPVVYWETDNGDMISITVSISGDNFEQKKIVNQKLFNLVLNFKTGFINKRQSY